MTPELEAVLLAAERVADDPFEGHDDHRSVEKGCNVCALRLAVGTWRTSRETKEKKSALSPEEQAVIEAAEKWRTQWEDKLSGAFLASARNVGLFNAVDALRSSRKRWRVMRKNDYELWPWAVIGAGFDRPICWASNEPEAHLIANALNALPSG